MTDAIVNLYSRLSRATKYQRTLVGIIVVSIEHAHEQLKTDREIFLQRLELDDFETFYRNRQYRVPQVFRNDKEVMLKIVSKNSLALSNASQELKDDRQVVMAAIQNRQSSAPQAIQYASKKLKSDRRIARAVLRHGYGIKALKHLPRKLREDYKLVLLAVKSSSEECNETYETLSELSEQMVEDADIVFEAVKRRGSNLRFVEDLVLLDDIEIIKAACKNDGAAIQYCPKGLVRKEMLSGSNLKLVVENGGYSNLKKRDADHWMARGCLLSAAKNGLVASAEFMGRLYKQDPQLFMDMLRHTSRPFAQYRAIPEAVRSDGSVGLAILQTNESSQIRRGFAGTAPERVKRYSGGHCSKHIARLLRLLDTTMSFRSLCMLGLDKTIVVSLCKFKETIYNLAPSDLKTNLDVVKATLSGTVSLETIRRIPQTLLRQHHDIAAMAIAACRDPNPTQNWQIRYQMQRHLGNDLVKQPTVLLAWAKKGWPFYSFGRYARFNDNQVAVEALKHEKSSWEYNDIFRRFPKAIRGNKSVMLPAVQANPVVLKYVHDKLLQDYDFMLSVVGSGRKSLSSASHKDKVFDALAKHAMEVRANLAVTESFILHFLCAVAIAPPQDLRAKRRRTCRGPANQCHLRLLDACGDAGPSIKRMIAEYADIPIGEDLQILRSALDTLRVLGILMGAWYCMLGMFA